MKLIDADDFLKTSIENKRFAFQYKDLLNEQIVVQTVYSDLAKALNTAPTIDAVEVVRCKDCECFEETLHNEYVHWGYCYHWDYETGMSPNQVDADDYCSYGVRRER